MLETLPSSGWTPQAAAHLLNRAAFGGTPAEIETLHSLGLREAIDSLLHGEEELDLFPPPALEPMGAAMQGIRSGSRTQAEVKERQRENLKLARKNGLALGFWWINRMRETPNPAREKAALFWHGHWATGIRKVKDPFLMHQQNETLRARGLGPFAPLAKEITRDPAMIRYLDLQSSSAKKPNENFARELMELFTLGEGHYSESDIAQAARAFTGYRIDRRTGGFRFNPRETDPGVKTILGKTGPLSGDDVIEVITSKPRCAEFLAGKIWVFYAGTEPSGPLRKRLGDEYRRHGMRTGEFLASVFASREFHSPGVVGGQIKSPVQWLVQSCKILEIPVPGPGVSLPLLANLGQMPFDPPNVKGWDGGRAWISSSTLLLRYNAAGKLVRGAGGTLPDIDRIVPTELDAEQTANALSWRLFQAPMTAPLRERTLEFLSENGNSAAARRDLLHLLMSTPEYQLA